MHGLVQRIARGLCGRYACDAAWDEAPALRWCAARSRKRAVCSNRLPARMGSAVTPSRASRGPNRAGSEPASRPGGTTHAGSKLPLTGGLAGLRAGCRPRGQSCGAVTGRIVERGACTRAVLNARCRAATSRMARSVRCHHNGDPGSWFARKSMAKKSFSGNRVEHRGGSSRAAGEAAWRALRQGRASGAGQWRGLPSADKTTAPCQRTCTSRPRDLAHLGHGCS